ncbi:MAG TPA: 2Fe-2S iron-sulfur cluster-binding protein [Chitinophagales bacterium]|nr:2Fe-2S iron-sulfur cluster-binding protein [Chitinophagales bacterium]HRK26695.1 2Fe-2S iron-sulfur cluster-binding protein [Chitinophagales bacterium]
MGFLDFFKGKSKNNQQTPENKRPLPTPAVKNFYRLNVAKVVKETDDAISVYLQVPTNLQGIFAYKAGQYITIKQEVNGASYLRSYSISLCPQEAEAAGAFLRIGIKRKPGGAVSGYLVDNLAADATMEVFPPLGNFIPDLTEPSATYFLFAGGSGITPMIAIAQCLLKSLPHCKVVLYYANRTAKGIIYFDEITTLAETYGSRFAVWHIIDEELNPYVVNALGFEPLKGVFYAHNFVQELTARYADALADSTHFICGPMPMLQEVEHALYELGVNAGNIKIEFFEIEKQTALPATDSSQPESQPPAHLKLNRGDTLAKVHLQGKTHWVVIPKGDTVLNACLNAGLDAPFMCESGVCATCRASLIEGKVTMMANYSLNAADIEKGFILTCQSMPETDNVEVLY